MAIDVPYHYEHAPRIEHNIRVESQNNWYLGAHRESTEIKVLDTATAQFKEEIKKEPPTWGNTPKNGGWKIVPLKQVHKKPAKAKKAHATKPLCTDQSAPTDDCLAPK